MCLDDGELLQLLFTAARDFARGEATDLFVMATMTAPRKPDGGVRGIATGIVSPRLVAKCLSRQFISEVEKVCAPYQFAMSIRAGTDCVGHAIRATTDHNPRTTVLSIDGVGAYDHVSRVVAFRPECLFPSFGVPQEEGSNDKLGSAKEGNKVTLSCLFCFAWPCTTLSLRSRKHLQEGEMIFAFLDDVYALSAPERSKDIRSGRSEVARRGMDSFACQNTNVEQSKRNARTDGGFGAIGVES